MWPEREAWLPHRVEGRRCCVVASSRKGQPPCFGSQAGWLFVGEPGQDWCAPKRAGGRARRARSSQRADVPRSFLGIAPTVSTLVWEAMIQEWFGYRAPRSSSTVRGCSCRGRICNQLLTSGGGGGSRTRVPAGSQEDLLPV